MPLDKKCPLSGLVQRQQKYSPGLALHSGNFSIPVNALLDRGPWWVEEKYTAFRV